MLVHDHLFLFYHLIFDSVSKVEDAFTWPPVCGVNPSTYLSTCLPACVCLVAQSCQTLCGHLGRPPTYLPTSYRYLPTYQPTSYLYQMLSTIFWNKFFKTIHLLQCILIVFSLILLYFMFLNKYWSLVTKLIYSSFPPQLYQGIIDQVVRYLKSTNNMIFWYTDILWEESPQRVN